MLISRTQGNISTLPMFQALSLTLMVDLLGHIIAKNKDCPCLKLCCAMSLPHCWLSLDLRLLKKAIDNSVMVVV